MTDHQDPLSQDVRVIDTHTGGEPTRVVVAGGPDLGGGPLAERRERFRSEFDEFRSAVVNEPRGSDVLVGALLLDPGDDSGHAADVIFFNNVGVIGMCGHGAMGVAVALAHAGRMVPGRHRLGTPVGEIVVSLHEDRRRVTVENVPSYRHRRGVSVDVPGYGPVTGDVAWGGNWFFLTEDHGLALTARRIDELTDFALSVRDTLARDGVTGRQGAVIDHIELMAPSDSGDADGRNFVLCPGGAWDRSPCGTGTSAKLACLAADGLLASGEVWRQESIVGSVFEATYRRGDDDTILPSLTGSAWVTAEATLLFDPADPFRGGIPR